MAGTTKYVRATGVAPDSDVYNVVTEFDNAVTDLETLRAALSKVDTVLDQVVKPDGVQSSTYTFATAGAVTIAVSGLIRYRISGIEYFCALPATLTLEDLGDITQNNFNAWRVEIDRLGAITTKSSPTVGGESTAEKALLSLSSIAPTASTATIGYMTVTETDAAFNIGTDNTNKASTTFTFYYERAPRKRIAGLNAALGAASTLTAASTTYGHGTIDANMNGLKKAQIAAGAAQALTDADTIATLKFGAVVVCTNLAGTGKVSVNAAGTPGVTAMSYSTAALALAAVNLVVDRLPPMFVPFTLIQVSNQSVSTFTFKTTNWDATSITSTITDATVSGWARGTPTGFDSNQLAASQPTATVVSTAGTMTAASITRATG